MVLAVWAGMCSLLLNHRQRQSMLNIAEGFARATDRDFIRFLSYAHSSLAEIQAGLYLSLDQHYIDVQQFDSLYPLAAQNSGLIRRLEKYLTKPGTPPR